MLLRVVLAFTVIAVGVESKLVKYYRAAIPVDDEPTQGYFVVAKHNYTVGAIEDAIKEITDNNETLEFDPQWTVEKTKILFAKMNKASLKAIRRLEGIVYIEQDGNMFTQTSEQGGGEAEGEGKTDSWGLDRIDQRNIPLDGVFSLPASAGTGANIYIIGTGIHVKHEEFGGRASNIYDYRGTDFNGRDCNGHGTHMASIAAGKNYGVAKNATIYGVRVAKCLGIAKLSDTVKAVTWLSRNAEKRSVAIMGMGVPGKSNTLDNALHSLYTASTWVVLPAGNNNSLACDYSPARMQSPITVGATTRADYAVFYSNHGDCVDLFAPGKSIRSAVYDPSGSKTAYDNRGGTSTAAAFVGGAVAYHIGNDMIPFKIKRYLISHATEDQLDGIDEGTPNKLLYLGSVSSNQEYERPKKGKFIPKETPEERNPKSEL